MGIEFDKLSDPAQLVGKPEHNADTATLIDLDMVHQLDQNIPRQLFDVLILPEGRQEGIFRINAVFQLPLFFSEPFQDLVQCLGLLLIVLFHVPVIRVRDLAVLPVLIDCLLISDDLGKLPFLLLDGIMQLF